MRKVTDVIIDLVNLPVINEKNKQLIEEIRAMLTELYHRRVAMYNHGQWWICPRCGGYSQVGWTCIECGFDGTDKDNNID